MSRIKEEAKIIRDITSGLYEKPAELRYVSALDAVDAEGVSFSVEPCEEALRGPSKQCYANAGRLALENPGKYIYVEGFSVLRVVPLVVGHAWVYDLEERKAIDVTWPEAGAEYLGIPFNTEWLRAWTLLRKYWGVLDSPAFLRNDVDPERYFSKIFPRGPLLIGNDNV